METMLPAGVRFGREICGDLAQAERREWWLANGLGGYAAGTIAGTLTRRYHGLLIAPLDPPLGRSLVLAKADATLLDERGSWPLFSNRWGGGAVDPAGYVHIESFWLDGRMPVWRYAIGDRLVEARVWLEWGANTVYLGYRLQAPRKESYAASQLGIKLLINARDHHGNTRSGAFDPVMDGDTEHLRVTLPNGSILTVRAHGGRIARDHVWIENFDLPVERERGLPAWDNHLCVGELRLNLVPGEWVGLVASLAADASPDLARALQRHRARDQHCLQSAQEQVPELRSAPAWVDQLVLAADSFVFSRPLAQVPDGESVIAGYPWFGDWGRDTMISLPGLTLATGRYDSARRILLTFAAFIDRGMLPNAFVGSGQSADYNTIDAALWYIEAWRAYLDATHDRDSLRRIFPALQQIIDAYAHGTRYSIAMDTADGLIRAGDASTQLTWMDARIDGRPVTPRAGKPVDVNALWYNALETMARMASALNVSAPSYRAMAATTRAGFQRFLNTRRGGLFDVLDTPHGNDDDTIRPNQILAVSLWHSALEPSAQASVVQVCGRELLTSYGMRSLAPGHPGFQAHYAGNATERDGAYHQGTVWAWLLGHYALAEYRVSGDAEMAQAQLECLRDHLNDAGVGTVSEIFDGAPPHLARGCPAQAWSVACTLQAWWRLERNKRARLCPDGAAPFTPAEEIFP